METLDINDIIVNNPYSRVETDVTELEKSISTIGLISPLIINDKNELLAGARRYKALKNLGYSEVPVLRNTKGPLEQELISIDENLVRKDLNKIEIEAHLRRAKEIYEKLASSDEQKLQEIKEQAEVLKENLADREGAEEAAPTVEILASELFVKEVSDKTGMSPRQIHQAISRDEKSSKALKEAREQGEVNISQTNEVIKLTEQEQEAILPHIKDKTVSEIRKIVKEAKSNGVGSAIEMAENVAPNAKEVKQLLIQAKKLRQLAGRLELEKVEIRGENSKKLINEIKIFSDSFDAILPELSDTSLEILPQMGMNQSDAAPSLSVQ